MSAAAVEVQNLSYRYAGGAAVLQGISFRIAAGERVAIVGPNGAGKSTLLLHLNGILPDKPGAEAAIQIGDVPVAAERLHEVRRKVGLLFQDPDDQLFCPTVYEDVRFGPQQFGREPAEVDRVVRLALEQAGVAGLEDRPPHRLSHGEKRRVCLAGVLACEPEVLVLDEPTSNLDPRGRRELLELLQKLEATQLIATHDLELAVRLCSRVLVLDGGKLVAAGATCEVLADEKLMLAHGLERPHILQHVHPH